MPQQVTLAHSKTQIVKAGKLLRKHHSGEFALTDASITEATDKLDHWRVCHSYPLTKATMGLRTRVNTER